MLREYFVESTYFFDPFFLVYFASINLVYVILLLLGCIKIYKRQQDLKGDDFTHILRSDSLPEIAFFVTAYNEENNILPAVDNLLYLSYRYKQIIIINDGSTDNTLERLKERYQLLQIPKFYEDVILTKPIRGVYRSKLFQEIIVIDKENGKKDDALNAALNLCQTPYFITVDADTFVDNQSFEALIRPMLVSPETIATGASVRLRNGCTLDYNRISTDLFPQSYVAVMQAIEYLRAFLMRQGWDYAGGNYVLSGAFAIFATEAVKSVGGYAPTVANDLEIVVRLNRIFKATKTPYRIRYLPDPVAWTEGPSTMVALGRQRFLWQRGLMESVWFHKGLFFNPRYGWYGLFVYPFLIFGEVLEPLVEILGCIYIVVGLWIGVLNWVYVSILLLSVLGFTFLYTLFCLLIEELTFRKYPSSRSFYLLVWYSFLENFGYRQRILWWRIKAFKGFFQRFSEIHKDSKRISQLIKKIVKQGKIQW